MNRKIRSIGVVGCMGVLAGCGSSPSNTFMFTAELPEGFVYRAVAQYEPEEGENCKVRHKRQAYVGYNINWREQYVPIIEIAIRRTANGCPLIISRINIDIYSTYGKARGDFSTDSATVAILSDVEDQYKGSFNSLGQSTFHGECQWLFRTSGKPRILRKILDCKETNEQGTPAPGGPFAAYTYDQLAGKTVKMAIKLSKLERPSIKNTWIKVPNGWKRCIGDNFEDQYAFCFDNRTDFSTFKMVDGRTCTIYPGCTE